MQDFINRIFQFIRDLRSAIDTFFSNISLTQYNAYIAWNNKNVFTDNSLIGLNITWSELLYYLLGWFLIFLIFVLFIKFVLKLVSIFRV